MLSVVMLSVVAPFEYDNTQGLCNKTDFSINYGKLNGVEELRTREKQPSLTRITSDIRTNFHTMSWACTIAFLWS
jgi:hypothetical protein